MRLRKRPRQVTNPDDFETVKAWNAIRAEQGLEPLPPFDHSRCGPECMFSPQSTKEANG